MVWGKQDKPYQEGDLVQFELLVRETKRIKFSQDKRIQDMTSTMPWKDWAALHPQEAVQLIKTLKEQFLWE